MKKLLLLLLLSLAACSPNDSDPTHAAVTAYLQQHANDPAIYEAVRWGLPTAFTRRDSAAAAAEALSSQYDRTAAEGGTPQRAGLLNTAIRLEAITDTTRVGTRLTHAFRGRNKLGATVLDSAQFVVYRTGQVQAL